MANFDKYAPRLDRYEGRKFVDDPDDYGGATYRGVTLTTFREVFGAGKTVEDLKAMTEEQWRRVMKGLFWDKIRGDEIKNQSVAEIICDWVVNSGLSKIRKVQEFAGTKADGIVGPKTVAAINGADQLQLHRRIKLERARRFLNQIDANFRQMKYFDGWFARLVDLKFEK